MSDDYVDVEIRWMKEDIEELDAEIEMLKKYSHPPVEMWECPTCKALISPKSWPDHKDICDLIVKNLDSYRPGMIKSGEPQSARSRP